jgi:hypothetical protein
VGVKLVMVGVVAAKELATPTIQINANLNSRKMFLAILEPDEPLLKRHRAWPKAATSRLLQPLIVERTVANDVLNIILATPPPRLGGASMTSHAFRNSTDL